MKAICIDKEVLNSVLEIMENFPEVNIEVNGLEIEVDASEEWFYRSGACVRSCFTSKEVYS